MNRREFLNQSAKTYAFNIVTTSFKRILVIATIFALSSCSFIDAINQKETNEDEIPNDITEEKISKTMYPQFEDQANRILAHMSLEEKVGQMFLVRHPAKDGSSALQNYHFGGLLFFAKDFQDKSKNEVIEMISSYQNDASIPLLMAVDEEGGNVNRISKYKQFRDLPFSSPRALYKKGGFELIETDTIEKANLLLSLGINLNLAPVADVSFDPKDYMYQRAFGESVEQTANYIQLMVMTMNKYQIGSTLKHFPGYGNNADTHTGIAYDHRSYEEFMNQDFIPFVSGIKAGVPSILVSHNIVSSMDSSMPASLSKKVHDILRDELEFQGVIMTDDLYMDAIKTFVDIKQAAVLAVQAGNDVIISTNYSQQIPSVIEAVNNNEISIDQINESVLRILCWKMALNLNIE